MEFNEKKLKEKYRRLINDSDFEKLSFKLYEPNIFSILGINNREIRHSNFLSWLLNPNNNHGFRETFLKKIIRDIVVSNKNVCDFDELEIENLDFASVKIQREWNCGSKRIDIIVIFSSLVVAIENKIYSQDYKEINTDNISRTSQLTEYRNRINDYFKEYNKIFVYLTPHGDRPNESDELNYYALYSYKKVISHLEELLDIYRSLLNSKVYIYIIDYIKICKKDLMKNDDVNKLAEKIYNNHKDLFDFINENKPDYISKRKFIISEKIKEYDWNLKTINHEAYVRFLTQNLDDIIPKKGEYWSQENYSFLFEFEIRNEKNLKFKTVIPPGNDDVRNILREALENASGSKVKKDNKGLYHFDRKWDLEEIKFQHDKSDEETIRKILDDNWSEINNIVQTTESEILKFQDKLRKYIK